MSESTIAQSEEGGRAEREAVKEPVTLRPAQDDRAGEERGWQEKARAYSRARLRFYAISTATGLLFAFGFWYLGISAILEAALGAVAGPWWSRIVLFVVVYEAIAAILFLPISYYGGFVLQHRFGLSTQDFRGWLLDWAKSSVIGGLFFVAGMAAFYLVTPALPGDWWWILAIGLTLVALLLTYVAPVLLLPVFYKRTPVADAELEARILALAAKAGARVSRVSMIDMSRRTVAANAALTGIGRNRQVLLGDTMLQHFSEDEVETVFAHELGHHVHGDIWKGLGGEVLGIWLGLAVLYYLIAPAMVRAGIGEVSDLANLPLLVFLAELASLAAMPLVNAVSRRYESQADRFAVKLSEKPEAYSRALYRLARQNLAELWPPRWVELLLYTHPAIGRRMASIAKISD